MSKIINKESIDTNPTEFAKLNSTEDENGCLNWKWALSGSGYGNMKYNGKSIQVIRILKNCPADKVVRHLCNNKKCINPDHLIIGTQKENMRDRCKNGDCSHCEDQTRAGKVTWSVPIYAKFGCCKRCYHTKFKSNPMLDEEYDQYYRDRMNRSNAKKRLQKSKTA